MVMRTRTRPGAPAGWRYWATLPVILTGAFMITLDFFIVNVAIPSMQEDLRLGPTSVELVVAGYGLAAAAGLITGGRLGDIYGRRRVFAIGLAGFVLASLVCGLAPDATTLVAGRIGQGLASALLAPQELAILGLVYTGADRTRAFNAVGLVLGLAGVFGQLIGGLLIQADPAGLGWRMCFLVNVPVGLVALALVPGLVPESRATGRPTLDLPGAALVTLGLVAVLLPLTEGRQQGWPGWSWVCLASAPPVLAAFVAHQRRRAARGGSPLVDLTLFRLRSFSLGVVALVAFHSALASFFLVLALYLQFGRGLDALGAGWVFVAVGAGFVAASTAGPQLVDRLGRRALVLGAAVLATGWVLLGIAVAAAGTTGGVGTLTPALLVVGVGIGLVMAPLASFTLAGVSSQYAGAASGVLSTATQVGNALGIALIGVVFYGALGHDAVPADFPRALGFSVVYLLVLTLVVMTLVRLLPRSPAPG